MEAEVVAKSVAPIVVTCGEPAGIGLDLAIDLAHRGQVQNLVFLTCIAALRRRASELGNPVRIIEWPRDSVHGLPTEHPRGGSAGVSTAAGQASMTVLDFPFPVAVAPGCPHPGNTQVLLDGLRHAVTGCIARRFSALVTGPVNKAVINEAGVAFTGHTEFLQALAGVPQVVMMLASEAMRVALVTTHLPLGSVAAAITPERLESVLRVLERGLREQFAVPCPRVLVAGLNPHAGEGGHLGREEISVIGPVLEKLRLEGMNLEGPLPADTLFTPRYLEQADAVLAMYHDQGLPVLKYQSFGRAANITLGLPFIRTSVDHGTAYDLAGTGRADCGSLLVALSYARRMAAVAPFDHSPPLS